MGNDQDQDKDNRDQYVRFVAHELKNPLAGMVMNADVLRNSLDMLPPERLASMVDKIYATASMMTSVVDQILDFYTLKEGAVELNLIPTHLDNVLKTVIETYRIKASEKSITLHYENVAENVTENVTVMADMTAMNSVLSNIISNAIKYTEPDKNVYISLISYNGRVRVAVRDEGLGLTPDDLDKLFVEFAKLSTRPTGGERSNTIGLALVKMQVEAMQGTVWAESDGQGHGTTFTIEFPVVKS